MKKEILKKLQVILKVFVAIVLVFSTTTLVNAEDGDVDNIIFDVSGQLVEAKETSNQVKISLKITNTSETDLTLDSIKADIPEGVNYVSIEQENAPSQEDDGLLWTDQSLSAKKELVLTYELDVSKDASTQMSWYVNDEKLKEITDIKDILSEEDIKKIEGNATTKDGANLIQKEVSKVWTRFKAAGVVRIGNEDELRAFFTNSKNGEKTAQLTSHINITNSNIISVQRNATLDLNGYSIYVKTGSKNELFNITNKASFNVQDSNGEHDNKETVQYKVTTVQEENKPVTEKRTYTGGVITGNKKNTFRVDSESTLKLENVCIYNNGKAADGYDGGAVINYGVLYLNGALLVQNKGSWGGAIQTNGNSKIYINDNTILSENNAYRRGGAIYASGNAEIVMNGGYLTNNEANSTGTNAADGGGAIRLDGSSSFTMNNGYVTGNKSNKGSGGGIRAGWYDYNQYGPTNHVIVNINSGYISGNTSGNEGAGMSIGSGCHANIDPATNEKVYITYNTVTETEDWGGGGLFVANDGTMHITNLLVKDNHADGFGGGIAGCSTGRVFDFSSKGGAIFDNSATGENLSGNSSSKAEDHAYTQGNAVFHNSGYQDYFCALNSVIDNKMLGGGYEQWSGSIDNIPFSAGNNDEQLSSTFLMGMTANPIQEDKILAKNNAKVIVSHNSSYTHGGGILCNGYLVVGNVPETLEIGDRLLVNAKKLVKGASHANNTFHFDLLDSDMKLISTMTSVGIDGKTNEGDINIAIPFSLTTNTGEFTYYLMEEPTDGFYPNTTAYKIVIKGERKTESNNVMGATVEKSVITDVTVTKGVITKSSNGTTTNKVFTEQGTVSITKDLNTGSNHAKLLNIEPNGYAYRNTVKPGNLTITKTSIGTTTPADTEFTITGPESYSKTVKYSEFKDGKYTIENLPVGDYTVTENSDSAKVDTYTLKVTGEGIATVKKGETASITITNVYTKDKGSLEITKQTSGATTPADTEFTITGPGSYSKTVKYSEFKDGKYTIENLPVGVYTVTENRDSAKVDTYTLKVTGEGIATVKKGETASITITNVYTKDKGSLEITKQTSGATTPADTEFTITGPGSYSKTVKYSEFKDGKYTIENLPVGVYTVTENRDSAKVDTYTLKVTGEGIATVKKGETASITITNVYTKDKGSLEITKQTSGATTPADTEFTITGPESYSKTVKYSEFKDGKYTIENLPVGDYTVTENSDSAKVDTYTLKVTGEGIATVKKDETASITITNVYTKDKGSLEITKQTSGATTPADTEFTITGPESYSKTVKYSEFKDGKYTIENLPVGDYTVTENSDSAKVDTYTLKVTGEGIATVKKGETASITITNVYTKDKGSLEITKQTSGATTPADTEFTITGPGSYSKTVKYSEFKDGKYTIENLPVGVYTVTENRDSAKVDTYTLKVTGEGIATVKKGETASITITNVYTKDKGSLEITKQTSGSTTPADTEFTITGPESYSKTVKYSEFKDGKYTIENLPVGVYTVTENSDSAKVDTYTLKVTGEGIATVKKGETASITITNVYTKDKGSLEITKQTSGATTPADTEFTITGPESYSKTVKYSEFKDGKYKIENLPVGDYTVTENSDSAKVDTYTLKVTGEGIATVKKGETASITITNVYTKDTGDLVITKTSMGTTTPKDAVFTITGPNDYSKDINYSDFTDGEYVLEGLPVGEYKVVESNANVKGYTLTVTGNGSTAIVAKDEESQISIVNNYVSDKKASLIIYKVDQDGNFLEGANFQMEREDGEIINAIKDRARFEFKDLIDGTYTVKETTTPEGYEGIGEFEIVIENGKITCPEYGITDPFVTLSVENTNDGTTPEVIGDEYDDDDFYPEVQGDEKVETSDNTNIAGFAGLSLLSAMMFFFLRKKETIK